MVTSNFMHFWDFYGTFMNTLQHLLYLSNINIQIHITLDKTTGYIAS